jgi:cbb3-type cytochrome oxidase subunit 3
VRDDGFVRLLATFVGSVDAPSPTLPSHNELVSTAIGFVALLFMFFVLWLVLRYVVETRRKIERAEAEVIRLRDEVAQLRAQVGEPVR